MGGLNVNCFQSGKKLQRSWSAGSGDKVQSRNLENVGNNELSSEVVMETIPDIFNSLIISNSNSSVINNNKVLYNNDEKILNDFDDDMTDDSFDPGELGILENPGVVRFDSLDYPDFCDTFSDDDDNDELDSSEPSNNVFSKVFRFSFESLFSSSKLFTNRIHRIQRTKSLSDISEHLETWRFPNFLFQDR